MKEQVVLDEGYILVNSKGIAEGVHTCIQINSRPSVIHRNLEVANTEAKRISKLTGEVVYMFAVVAKAVPPEAPDAVLVAIVPEDLNPLTSTFTHIPLPEFTDAELSGGQNE